MPSWFVKSRYKECMHSCIGVRTVLKSHHTLPECWHRWKHSGQTYCTEQCDVQSTLPRVWGGGVYWLIKQVGIWDKSDGTWSSQKWSQKEPCPVWMQCLDSMRRQEAFHPRKLWTLPILVNQLCIGYRYIHIILACVRTFLYSRLSMKVLRPSRMILPLVIHATISQWTCCPFDLHTNGPLSRKRNLLWA